MNTVEYERLNFRLIEKIFYSTRIDEEDSTIIHDKKDLSVFVNMGAAFRLPPLKVEERLTEIERFLAKESRTPTFYTTPDSTPNNLHVILQARGYKQSFCDAWMFFQGKAEVHIPSHITIRQVGDLRDMSTFVDLFNRVYSGTDPSEPYGKAPDAWGENLYDSYGKTDPSLSVAHYIISEEDLDAGVLVAVQSNEFGGLYSIGTVPEKRKRGLSTLLTHYVVSALQNAGAKQIFLQTEKDTYNERFYKKIGFQTRWHGTGWSKA